MKQTKTKKVLRRIVVRNSPIHGRGVFAVRPIPKGTRILEYKGKLITDAEAERAFAIATTDSTTVIPCTRARVNPFDPTLRIRLCGMTLPSFPDPDTMPRKCSDA